jgi:BlaI family transcriptional regulator, penicillinase repressor
MDKLRLPEEDAMQAIWKIGQGSVKMILERLDPPRPPYTTLASTIKNLERKGYLSGSLVGNTYLYRPTVSAEDYKKKCMSGFVKDYFENSYKELVNFFVAHKKLGAKELKEIIDLIEADPGHLPGSRGKKG